MTSDVLLFRSAANFPTATSFETSEIVLEVLLIEALPGDDLAPFGRDQPDLERTAQRGHQHVEDREKQESDRGKNWECFTQETRRVVLRFNEHHPR